MDIVGLDKLDKIIVDKDNSGDVVAVAKKEVVQCRTCKIMPDGRIYATGKRKTAIARIFLKSGSGVYSVNKSKFADYFSSNFHKHLALQPLVLLDKLKMYDIYCTLKGGGLSSQAGALKHGLAKALLLAIPEARSLLRKNNLLTRDSRIVERKKCGLRKARKKEQFSKR